MGQVRTAIAVAASINLKCSTIVGLTEWTMLLSDQLCYARPITVATMAVSKQQESVSP